MTSFALSTVAQNIRVSPAQTAVIGITVLWVGAVIGAALAGVFDVPPGSPAVPTLMAIGVPVLAFGFVMWRSSRARRWVLALDPALLTELQAWRVLGGVFLVAYAYGFLPGLFAWPAGLGDLAIGLCAPFVAHRLRTAPTFLTSRRLLAFILLGLADFVIAVGTGIASRNQIPGLVDQVTTAPMGQLPLVLIPTIAVPAFIILHLMVLTQVLATTPKRRHRSSPNGSSSANPTN